MVNYGVRCNEIVTRGRREIKCAVCTIGKSIYSANVDRT